MYGVHGTTFGTPIEVVPCSYRVLVTWSYQDKLIEEEEEDWGSKMCRRYARKIKKMQKFLEKLDRNKKFDDLKCD